MGWESFTGLYRNLIACSFTGVIALTAVGGSNYLRKRRLISSELSRKIVHVSASCWLVVWPYFDSSHWSWRLNAAVPLAYSVVLFVKGLIIKDRNDPDVRTMSRTGDPSELLLGPLMFTMAMTLTGLALFGREEGAMMMAVLGFGDGFAPVIGKKYGKHRYKALGRVKTIEGSLACFVFSLIGMQVFRSFLGYPYYNFVKWVIVASVGTIVEAFSPSDFDNILIPLAVYHTMPIARYISTLV
eukprot:jgi/Bigna1/142322/aug1.69_g17030